MIYRLTCGTVIRWDWLIALFLSYSIYPSLCASSCFWRVYSRTWVDKRRRGTHTRYIGARAAFIRLISRRRLASPEYKRALTSHLAAPPHVRGAGCSLYSSCSRIPTTTPSFYFLNDALEIMCVCVYVACVCVWIYWSRVAKVNETLHWDVSGLWKNIVSFIPWWASCEDLQCKSNQGI